MSELVSVFDIWASQENEDTDNKLLPISHSTAVAQIEITVNEQGEILNASKIAKENGVTIIPVTEDSGARTSGVCPMPLYDQLKYIAGDYYNYAGENDLENKFFYEAYIQKLAEWKKDEKAHEAVKIIYRYIEKGEVVKDLLRFGVLVLDEQTGKLAKDVTIEGINQEKAFIRFRIAYADECKVEKTWLDSTLYDDFIRFNERYLGDVGLCYATGEYKAITYKHPSKIRNSADKAKLLSANDESGFTYRGRFNNKEETIAVSYEYSQKAHNALKWLIAKQGKAYGDLVVVTWVNSLEQLPRIEVGDDDLWGDEETVPSTLPQYRELLRKMILGSQNRDICEEKVKIMGLDAATTGRLSIPLYDELDKSDFYSNICSWHENIAWNRYDPLKKERRIRSFGMLEIIDCAVGMEKNGYLECDKVVRKDYVLRMLPCVLYGKAIPIDIFQKIIENASNPVKYDNEKVFSKILESACGVIKYNMIKRKKTKGDDIMSYDKNNTDRSYLYGCLLAIADKAERDVLENENSNRITNAKRYWSAFASRPYQTWSIIEDKLELYLQKNAYRGRYDKLIDEVMSKFTSDSFTNNSKLEPIYLLGYHQFMQSMYEGKNKEEE